MCTSRGRIVYLVVQHKHWRYEGGGQETGISLRTSRSVAPPLPLTPKHPGL
jgi:hypothetical protein